MLEMSALSMRPAACPVLEARRPGGPAFPVADPVRPVGARSVAQRTVYWLQALRPLAECPRKEALRKPAALPQDDPAVPGADPVRPAVPAGTWQKVWVPASAAVLLLRAHVVEAAQMAEPGARWSAASATLGVSPRWGAWAQAVMQWAVSAGPAALRPRVAAPWGREASLRQAVPQEQEAWRRQAVAQEASPSGRRPAVLLRLVSWAGLRRALLPAPEPVLGAALAPASRVRVRRLRPRPSRWRRVRSSTRPRRREARRSRTKPCQPEAGAESSAFLPSSSFF